MLKIFIVLGSKQQRKWLNWGQNFHENACVQNSTKSREKYKATTEIIKINLVIENIGGLGSKQQRKRVNWGQTLHENACVQNSTKPREKYKATT